MNRTAFTVVDGGSASDHRPVHPMAARRSPLVVLLSLALTVLLAGVVGLFAYSARMRIQKSYAESRMGVALDRATRGDQLLAEAKRTLVDPRSLGAALLAPDVVTVELQTITPPPPATAQAQGQASGRLFWSRSSGLAVVVTGLPAERDGFVLRVGGPGVAPTVLGPLNGAVSGTLAAGFAASPAPGATVEIVPAQAAAGTSPVLSARLPR